MNAVCPTHGNVLDIELVMTDAGCCQNEQCYCDTPDVHAELFCTWSEEKEHIKNGKSVRKYKGTCSYRVTVVEGLTDLKGIDRWIRAKQNEEANR